VQAVRVARSGRSSFSIQSVFNLACRTVIAGGTVMGGSGLLTRDETRAKLPRGPKVIGRAVAGQ